MDFEELKKLIKETIAESIEAHITLPKDYSKAEAAKLLHIHYNKLQTLINKKEVKLNSLGRVPASEIKRLIDKTV